MTNEEFNEFRLLAIRTMGQTYLTKIEALEAIADLGNTATSMLLELDHEQMIKRKVLRFQSVGPAAQFEAECDD